MNRTRLHLLFFASGAVGLVYEVLWMRRFTVLFGATAPASAATLSAFFLGLGLGSALLGARCPRFKRPLAAFGLLEAGVALGALLVEPALGLVEALTPHLGLALSDRPIALLAFRMLFATLAILPSTLCMGGTFPVLAEAVAGDRGRLGVRAGGLYAMNTLGAALGSVAVPTVLLPQLGARGALGVAVCGSLAIAIAAVRAAPSALDGEVRAAGQPIALGPSLLVAAFVSGAAALGLEVLWTRTLALVHENSVHSFAVVLAVYLVGTGAGAGLARSLLARGWSSAFVIGAGWIGAGLWVGLTPNLFVGLTSGLDYVKSGGGLLGHELKVAGLAVVTLFPATLLGGAVLPALMERAGGAGGIAAGPVVGRLLLANTLGAITGPLVALFVVGPALGLWSGMALWGGVLTFAGAVALRRPVSCVPFLLLVVLLQPSSLPRARIVAGERLIDLGEGAFGTVAVVEKEGHRRMRLNNHYVLGGTASTGEERLQAHIPLLLHRAPAAVAFLGLGTGITASAALFHPVREVVAMELVPEVVAAARNHFREANLRVLEDPRVRTVTDDARSYLRLTEGAFDVIIGDLVVPWRRGESSLYTLESFESARRALAPGGIYCQWVPLFQISEREFTIIAATFLDVFPDTVLWRGDFRAGEPAVALVGLTASEPLDPASIDARATEYARTPDPANPYLAAPAGLWAYLVGPLSPEDPQLRRAPRSRDRWPIVELSSPAVHLSEAAFIAERLKPFLDSVLARPLGGTPLAQLDAAHLSWRQAGARIWEASLLSFRGRDSEADALAFDALSTLPEPLRDAVLGPR